MHLLIILFLHDAQVLIAFNNPGPKPSYGVDMKDRNNSQTHNDDRDGNGGSPKNPLSCAHVTYIVCIHAEKGRDEG